MRRSSAPVPCFKLDRHSCRSPAFRSVRRLLCRVSFTRYDTSLMFVTKAFNQPNSTTIFVTIDLAYDVFVTARGDKLQDQSSSGCPKVKASPSPPKHARSRVITVQRPPAKASAQIFRYLLKRGIKTLAKNDAFAVFLDELGFSEIVLVTRTRSRLMDGIAALAPARRVLSFVRCMRASLAKVETRRSLN